MVYDKNIANAHYSFLVEKAILYTNINTTSVIKDNNFYFQMYGGLFRVW